MDCGTPTSLRGSGDFYAWTGNTTDVNVSGAPVAGVELTDSGPPPSLSASNSSSSNPLLNNSASYGPSNSSSSSSDGAPSATPSVPSDLGSSGGGVDGTDSLPANSTSPGSSSGGGANGSGNGSTISLGLNNTATGSGVGANAFDAASGQARLRLPHGATVVVLGGLLWFSIARMSFRGRQRDTVSSLLV
jgi:hypothetical protein